MKVSIITATYNSKDTIKDTLESINKQTYPNIEHIVVDGLSIDNTLSLVKTYGDRVSICISEKDNGIYDALNKGIELATGDIIGFLHSDDIFAKDNAIELIVNELTNSQASSVYSDIEYVKKNNNNCVIRRWRSGEYKPSKLKYGWMPPHPTFYMRKECYRRLGGFDTSLRISADYDAMLRYLLDSEMKTTYIPTVLVKMKVGGESNRNLKNILLKSKEDLSVIKHHNLNGICTLIFKNVSKIKQFLHCDRFFKS